MKGFGYLVVRSADHAFDYIIHRTHPRNQDDIDVWSMTALPHFTAYFGAAHARHDPVENGEWGPIRPLKCEPGLRTVIHSLSLIAKFAHDIAQKRSSVRFIISY